jgi:hypothetical protein
MEDEVEAKKPKKKAKNPVARRKIISVVDRVSEPDV